MIKDFNTDNKKIKSIEFNFPVTSISSLAEQESWRKEINRPIYHIHKWWATRLGSVFRGIVLGSLTDVDIWENFYKHHRLAEKIVLDPFMGSGTTIGESIKLGAKAIGCDINPISKFAVQQAFTRVPLEKLSESYSFLESQVAEEIKYYYKTTDPYNQERIPVLYYFWVSMVSVGNSEEIPLFSRYIFAQDAYPNKKPKAKAVCPQCWGIFETLYNSIYSTCPDCGYSFNPQEGPVDGQYVKSLAGKLYKIKDLSTALETPFKRRLYAVLAIRNDGTKIYLKANESDFLLYNEAKNRLSNVELPLPTMLIRPGHNTNQARDYNYKEWRDLYNARQLLCLGLLLKKILEIEDIAVQEQMLCLFSSTLEFNNLFCSYKGEGTGAVRHIFSNHILKPERSCIENSIWGHEKSSGTFCKLYESRLLKAKKYLDEPFEIGFEIDIFGNKIKSQKIISSHPIDVKIKNSWEEFRDEENGVLLLNTDSSSLPIPSKAVDAIVTDPPYFDFIHYSELSDFFFSWLAPILRKRYEGFSQNDSSSKGEVQDKNPRVFATQLTSVFQECHRVLKDDGLMAFTFHHSRAEGWAAIHEAIKNSGFSVIASHPVHSEMRTSSPKSSSKDPINIDAILVCKKTYCKDFLYDSEQETRENILGTIHNLGASGMKFSKNDKFVIVASMILACQHVSELTFEEVSKYISEFWENIAEEI